MLSYPRSLLYCSSFTPCPKVAGRLLLYRHLSRLKSYELLTVGPVGRSAGNLDCVIKEVAIPIPPFWRSGLRRGWFYTIGDQLTATYIRDRFEAIARPLQPLAVLTLFSPDAYLTAAADFAKIHQLPLILFCHDDYHDLVPTSFRCRMAHIYRQAAVRLCISEVMEDEYNIRYGVPGTTLYPIPSGPAKMPSQKFQETPVRIGVAGSIHNGYEEAIVRLADAVSVQKGEIFILSPTPRNTFRRIWSHPAIRDGGHVSPENVSKVFERAEINTLAVIQSFAQEDERAYQFNFPSKLTEYTTFGLPLLIVAPKNASAVRWVKSRGEHIALVSSDSPNELCAAVDALKDSSARHKLAVAFYQAAREFAPERLQNIFEEAIASVIK